MKYDIDLSKYGLVEGFPETEGIYSAFMEGWRLGKAQAEK